MSWPVLSYGVVSPGGMGVDALSRPWLPTATQSADGTRRHTTFLVDREAPDLKRSQREPRLRRASPLSSYLLEAARQALEAAPGVDRKKTGVVASLFLGCLVYSIRFYRQLTEDGRRFASPLLFPETVFNSPLSHVVTTLGLGGPVYSQVGDTSSWATALRTADCWLTNGSAEHVLVLGAEEFEPHALDAFHAAGFFRKPTAVSEGAGALLLSREGPGVALMGVADGYAFHSRNAANGAATRCLRNFSEEIPILDTAVGWTRTIKIPPDRPVVENLVANPCLAGTAAFAWDTILAAEILKNSAAPKSLVIPYWGHTHQCAAAHLARP